VAIFDQRTARVLSTILLFLAVGAFVWGARHTVIAFLFAIFFAYLLDPLVSLISNTRLGNRSRGRSILIAYLLLVAVIGTLLTLFGSKLVSEARALGGELPTLLERVKSGQIAHQIGSQRGWSWTTQQRLEQFLASHSDEIVAWAQQFGGRAAELATNIIWLILIPILAIFFLRDGREFSESLIRAVDRRSQRQLLRGIMDDLHRMLASYIRAQVTLAIISMVMYTLVLSIMRVPYAIVLGVFGGILEFIPVVGPLVAAASIFGVAFLSSYSHLLIVLIFLGLWRLIQDYVISPRVMGERVELHPLAALFAILMGGEIGGVVGVYLSIPAIATLRIVVRRWQFYEQLESATAPRTIVQTDRPIS
jgi:predicted PurR-regulated permease PerM